jgi:hypothetical protein
MSLEMAHKVILPPKKNYIPQFLKQRDINSYSRITDETLTLAHFRFRISSFPAFPAWWFPHST